MIVVNDRSVRATVARIGKDMVLQVELRDLKGKDRERVLHCLTAFACGLLARFGEEKQHG